MTPIIDVDIRSYRTIAKAATTVLEAAEFWRNSSYVGDKPVQKTLVKPSSKRFLIAFEVDEQGRAVPVNVSFEVKPLGLPSLAVAHCVDINDFLQHEIKAEDFK